MNQRATLPSDTAHIDLFWDHACQQCSMNRSANKTTQDSEPLGGAVTDALGCG